MSHDAAVPKLALVVPVYNDWECVSLLLKEIDARLAEVTGPIRVLLVDDCSSDAVPDQLCRGAYQQIVSVEHLRLRRNLGHQRAIAIGLSHAYEHLPCDAVLVMDADGEDRPDDAVRLVQRLRETNGALSPTR